MVEGEAGFSRVLPLGIVHHLTREGNDGKDDEGCQATASSCDGGQSVQDYPLASPSELMVTRHRLTSFTVEGSLSRRKVYESRRVLLDLGPDLIVPYDG